MNIYSAVEAIIALQKTSISYLTDSIGYKTAVAQILEELLDSEGIGKEYMIDEPALWKYQDEEEIEK